MLTLTLCTLYGNSAGTNGGAITNNGTQTLASTLTVGNTAINGAPDILDVSGNPNATINGVNFVGDTANSGLTASATLLTAAQNGAINLALLANNGGPTKTLALLSGSPAIEVGSNAAASPLTSPPTSVAQVTRASSTIQ